MKLCVAIALVSYLAYAPSWLTLQDVNRLRQQMQEQIDTDLGLAGLDKIGLPPAVPQDLQTYRAKWTRVNPEIAPFLGQWVKDWEIFPPSFELLIFPSRVKGRICLIEFRYNDRPAGGYAPGETVPPNPAPRFSAITLSKGQGRDSYLHLHKGLIKRAAASWTVQQHRMEFLGVVTPEQTVRVYAAKAIADLNSIPASLKSLFQAYQCIATLP